MSLGPGEIVLVLLVLLLLFGAKRLPELARSVGQASKEFKSGVKEGDKPLPPVEGACPFCGVEVAAGANFCPGCAKSASEIVAERSKQQK
jgi:sec-independent protein translocase protein TatA